MRIKMYDFIKDSLMYSKGFAKVTWNFKTKTKTIMEPVVGDNDKITFNKVRKSEIEHDDPNVEIIDPYDIYIDPDATSAGFGGNARFIIHRKMVTYEEVKDNPNYNNVDKIKSAEYTDQYLDKIERYGDNVPQKDKHNNMVELIFVRVAVVV